MSNRDVELSLARTLRVSSASLEQLSGRCAPELMVACLAGGAEKRFAVVISLLHPLKDRERELAEAERRKRERELADQRAAREAEAARQRALHAAEEAKRLAEEKAAAEEAERLSRIDIMEQVCQQERQARDPSGRRWVKCEKCGDVKPVDEFMMYGGAGRINLGICYTCGRK